MINLHWQALAKRPERIIVKYIFLAMIWQQGWKCCFILWCDHVLCCGRTFATYGFKTDLIPKEYDLNFPSDQLFKNHLVYIFFCMRHRLTEWTWRLEAILLTHFMPLVSFDTLRKPEVFDVFRGYRKRPVV